MNRYATPGVYREELSAAPTAEPRTGVAAFLGLATDPARRPPVDAEPRLLTLWTQFTREFATPEDGFLARAVRGFFENDGRRCYVAALRDRSRRALLEGLTALARLDDIDLVCAPDILSSRGSDDRSYRPPSLDEVRVLQGAVLDHCDSRGDRFAILDGVADVTAAVLQQRRALNGANGALYYPWIKVDQGPTATQGFVPPCGHIAGIYARSDARIGIHKAPANEPLHGVMDVRTDLDAAAQAPLNEEGVNALRGFPGRGIRVWGARTLSRDPVWRHVSVRRLFLTVGRWVERNLQGGVFEPNDPRLWVRIERELNAYCEDLFERGALQGRSPGQAYYVKCDAETNPPEVREAGQVVTEIGLAPAIPSEFIIVRITQDPGGVSVAGPNRP